MMDRELLELAAKAADIDHARNDDGSMAIFEDGIELSWGRGTWNPLTDDGDALRLAGTLLITVEIIKGSTWCRTSQLTALAFEENHRNSSPNAATRRAIVRAAAEIGRTK